MTNEELAELHRRWIWANLIKKQFEKSVPRSIRDGKPVEPAELFVDECGCYMSIWYGLLFVVLEGFRVLRIEVAPVQPLIKDIYENLKLFRNATFHPQRKYWSPKIFKILGDSESAKKIWTIHAGLGEFFLLEINKRKKAA